MATAVSNIPKNQSSHRPNIGGRELNGVTLPCGIVTVIVEFAGEVPGVTEFGAAEHVDAKRVVVQASPIAELNAELVGTGASVAT